MSGVESTDDDLMSSNSNEDVSVYLPTPERRTNAWLSKVRDDTDCTLANKINIHFCCPKCHVCVQFTP